MERNGAILILLGFILSIVAELALFWVNPFLPQNMTLRISVIDLNALREQAKILGKDVVLSARVFWPFRPGLRRIVFESPGARMSLLVIGSSGLAGNCTTPCSLSFKQNLPYVFFEVYIYSLEPKKEASMYYLVIRIAGSG